MWCQQQCQIKCSAHARPPPRTVKDNVAQNVTGSHNRSHHEAWKRANPNYVRHVTAEEAISGGVPATMPGSKAFWCDRAWPPSMLLSPTQPTRRLPSPAAARTPPSYTDLAPSAHQALRSTLTPPSTRARAFIELIAMAQHYGIPCYFVTFTAAENLWSDLQQACGNAHHGERPVDATRHYQRRWEAFKKNFLAPGTQSPLGSISRTWHRQEDQARGSLHVHMAIWIEGGAEVGEAYAKNIRGTAPHNCSTAAEYAWRDFVINVQRHECRPKCTQRGGVALDHCKYLYSRKRYLRSDNTVFPNLNVETDRYDQECYEEEDERLSTYEPLWLWLLAWGRGMNIQYCTSAGFLSYIAKYICKPEPHGALYDTEALRDREGLQSPLACFLCARIMGAPEAIYRALGFLLKSSTPVVHVPTDLPQYTKRALLRGTDKERRALLSDGANLTDNNYTLRFYNGAQGQYAKRPQTDLFESMLYPDYHSNYE